MVEAPRSRELPIQFVMYVCVLEESRRTEYSKSLCSSVQVPSNQNLKMSLPRVISCHLV